MAGCPTLRTRPVAPPCTRPSRPSRKAHSRRDTQRVHTRGVASRDREVVARDSRSRARLCMLAASVGTRRTFLASRYDVTLA